VTAGFKTREYRPSSTYRHSYIVQPTLSYVINYHPIPSFTQWIQTLVPSKWTNISNYCTVVM